MAEPVARIRPVDSADQRYIRFLIGKAGMEPIAVANNKMYLNPFVLALWLGISSVLIQFMDWWPKPEHGAWGYLAPVPAFGTLSIAFMFAIDWLNRWGFEDHSAKVLRRPDLVDIPNYYSRSPASGFWVLEYGGRFIGIIAVDASLDAESDEVIAEKPFTQDRSGKIRMSTGTSKIATIRHFFVEEQYRSAGMANDLLEYALKYVFTSDAKVDALRASESPLHSYIGQALHSHGFKLEKNTDRVGALRWQNSIRVLDKTHWASTGGAQR